MHNELLTITNLVVKLEDKAILTGVNLRLATGETHALMGPNGGGKSTLAQVLAGNPSYPVDSGEIVFAGKTIGELAPDARSRLGIFLSFQYPLEIAGVNVASYLRMIYSNRFGKSIPPVKFRSLLAEKMAIIDMQSAFSDRYLNEGFSGGEKKRMEILQMLILEPQLVILDEVDSGLDVDALKSVAAGIAFLRRKNPETALLVITHHARILDYLKPEYVHVMQGGKIVKSGGFEVAKQVEATGYTHL
jgi:Fe-S cluster assembly ATP-binding protein